MATTPRQNCLPPLAKNGDIVTKKSKTEKKEIDLHLIFVEWISVLFADRASTDDMNRLYSCLIAYAAMRKDTKSPLNTKRKVDGLLEDLLEKSMGSLDSMCSMLITAKRRCWLSVHAASADHNGPAVGEPDGRRFEEL